MVKLTHPDKILFPEVKITKQDLVDYYNSVADWILPYVINRPITLVRCPNGINKSCFYQKHATQELSEHIYLIAITEKTKKANYMYIKDLSGLLALVQLGALEIHLWNCHINNIEKPDCIIFDLDPDPKLKWEKVVEGANIIRDFLTEIHLKSFVKTSGGKGMHIVVPIKPDKMWREIKDFTESFANTVTQIHPDLFTANLKIAKRHNKIFIDYLRNSRGATTICAYSTRAKPTVPISTPVDWDELSNITPAQFTIENISTRLRMLKQDPWEDLLKLRQHIRKL